MKKGSRKGTSIEDVTGMKKGSRKGTSIESMKGKPS
jgi:hypothetical protein